MADVGGEVAGTILNMPSQILALIMRLLEMIIQNRHKKPEYEAAKINAAMAKTKLEKQQAYDDIHYKVGEVSLEQLKATGRDLAVVGCVLENKDDLPQVCELLNRRGLKYYPVSNQARRGSGEQIYLSLTVLKEDAQLAKDVLEKDFPNEKHFEQCEDEINRVNNMDPEDRTAEDEATRAYAEREKERMQREDGCDNLNKDTEERILSNESAARKMQTLDQVLDKNTGRYLDKDQNTVVVDARNQNKRIMCHGTMDTKPDGKQYVKTEYTVIDEQGNKKVFDDGYHNGVKNSWKQVKADINEALGESSGVYYKFMNPREFDRWHGLYNEQNASELTEMEKPHAERNYDAINRSLNEQLNKDNAYIKDGEVYDRESGRLMKDIGADTSVGLGERAFAREACTIHDQMLACEDIRAQGQELLYATAERQGFPEGSPEYAAAMEKETAAQAKMDAAEKRYDDLLTERKDINSDQAYREEEALRAREAEHGSDEKLNYYESNYQDFAHGDTDGYEHADERRGEDVRNGDSRMSTEEVASEVQVAREADTAKSNGFKDHTTSHDAPSHGEH